MFRLTWKQPRKKSLNYNLFVYCRKFCTHPPSQCIQKVPVKSKRQKENLTEAHTDRQTVYSHLFSFFYSQ